MKFPGMFIQWSERRAVLIDGEGLMLSAGTISVLEQAIALHKQHSPDDLRRIGMETVKQNHPELLSSQSFNEKYFG
jgi:hypothetical protein